MATPSGNAYSPPPSSDEVGIPSAPGPPRQRLRALVWPALYSTQEGTVVPMEAEVVHLGDPNNPIALGQVTIDGRQFVYDKEAADINLDLYLKARDRNYTDFQGTIYTDEPG